MINFKCLYSFSSPEFDVVEIKRLDQPEGAPLSDIYKWLVISRAQGSMTELHFKSMNQNETLEQRGFVEGELSFNEKDGTFKFQGKETKLVRENETQVSSEILNLISKFLFALDI